MTNSLREKIQALMAKFSLSSLAEQLTIVSAINSNDEQIQEIQSSLPVYVYKAIITQASTNAPTESVVLVNTFPGSSFSYVGAGSYLLDLGVDLSGYNVNTIQDCVSDTGTIGGLLGYVYGDIAGSDYQVQTANAALAAADDILVNYTLTIEAYSA